MVFLIVLILHANDYKAGFTLQNVNPGETWSKGRIKLGWNCIH